MVIIRQVPSWLKRYISRLWADRRQVVGHWLLLLILTGVVGGIAWAPVSYVNDHFYDRAFKGWYDYDRQFDYNEVMTFSQRLNGLVNQIEAEGDDWYPRASSDYAYAFIAELAAQFSYEGAANMVNYPTMNFAAAPSAGRHNHIGGTSDCENSFRLNLRYANPISAWHENPGWISTLSHELAHNHQGQVCYDMPRELVETTAELMNWEVLAGLANQGNRIALFVLIYDLRSGALSTAQGMALAAGEKALARFEKALRDIQGHDALKWSRYEKSMRFWAGDMERLEWILATYSAAPLNLIARHKFGGTIPDLALDTDTRDLKIDDLLYVLEHAEEMVDQALSD